MSRDVKIGFIVAILFLGSVAGAVWYKCHASPSWSLVELVPVMDFGAASAPVDPAVAAPVTPLLKKSPKLPTDDKANLPIKNSDKDKEAQKSKKIEIAETVDTDKAPEPKIKPKPKRDLYKVADSSVPLKSAGKPIPLTLPEEQSKPVSKMEKGPVILLETDDSEIPGPKKLSEPPSLSKAKSSARANSPSATVRSTPPMLSANVSPKNPEAPKGKKTFAPIEKMEAAVSGDSPFIPPVPSFGENKPGVPAKKDTDAPITVPSIAERKISKPTVKESAPTEKPASNSQDILARPPRMAAEDVAPRKPSSLDASDLADRVPPPPAAIKQTEKIRSAAPSLPKQDPPSALTARTPIPQKKEASDLPPVRRVDFADLDSSIKTPTKKSSKPLKEYTGPLPGTRVPQETNEQPSGVITQAKERPVKRPFVKREDRTNSEIPPVEAFVPTKTIARNPEKQISDEEILRNAVPERMVNRTPPTHDSKEPEIELTKVTPLPPERMQEIRTAQQQKTRPTIPSPQEPIADSRRTRERPLADAVAPAPEVKKEQLADEAPVDTREIVARSRPGDNRLDQDIESLASTKTESPAPKKDPTPPPVERGPTEEYVRVNDKSSNQGYAAAKRADIDFELMRQPAGPVAPRENYETMKPERSNPAGFERPSASRVKVISFDADKYVILEGDTLEKVAMTWYRNKDYAVSLGEFNRLNFAPDDPLRPGSRITLPPVDILTAARPQTARNYRPEEPTQNPPLARPAIQNRQETVARRTRNDQSANERVPNVPGIPENLPKQEIANSKQSRTAPPIVEEPPTGEVLPRAKQAVPQAVQKPTPQNLPQVTESTEITQPKTKRPIPADTDADEDRLPPVRPMKQLVEKVPPKTEEETKPAPQDAAPKSDADGPTYTVGPEETLWKIAKKRLGTGRRMKEIYELNKDRLSTEIGVVPAGTVLRMPKDAAGTK